MRWLHVFLTVLGLSFALPHGASAKEDTILIFAAASTRNAVEEAVGAFTQKSGETVLVSYGSSGTLARQIAAGAPADLYISANQKWVEWLQKEAPGSFAKLSPFASNRLVLIQPNDGAPQLHLNASLGEKLGGSRIAVGNVTHVPAGMYAQDALKSLGLWDNLKDHLAQTKDVRAALALVQRGEASAGIVYQTDAAITDGVRVAEQIPESAHDPIRYFVGVLSSGERKVKQASNFFDFLLSPDGQSYFRKYGFQPLGINAPNG